MNKIFKYLFCFCFFAFLFLLTSCLGDNPSNSLGGSSSTSKKQFYTINYVNDGSFVGTKTSQFLNYSSVVLPSASKTGYIFNGWYEGDTKVESITENRNYNLVAKYDLINYSIKYNLNGGYMTTPYKTREELVNDFMDDFNLYTNQNLSVEDYINLGSMKDINKESNFLYSYIGKWGWLVDFIKTVADSSNKSAWNSFKNCSSQSELNNLNDNYIYSIAYELRAFIGGFKYDKSSYFPTQDYSKSDVENKLWTFIPISYYTIVSDDIYYDDNYNERINIHKVGHDFNGWYLDSSFTKPFNIITSGSHENLTLYAKWSPKRVRINLTLNGGTLNTSTVIQGYEGEDVNLPRPSKEGLNFYGWYNLKTDEFVDINYIFPSEDVTLYARYGYTSYGEYTNTATFVANKDYYIAVSDSMTNEDKVNSVSGVLARLGSYGNSINSDVDGLYIGWYSPNGDENFKGCLDLDGIFNDMDVFVYLTFVSDEDGFDLYKFSFTEEQIYDLQGYCCDILTYEDTEFYDLIYFVLE